MEILKFVHCNKDTTKTGAHATSSFAFFSEGVFDDTFKAIYHVARQRRLSVCCFYNKNEKQLDPRDLLCDLVQSLRI